MAEMDTIYPANHEGEVVRIQVLEDLVVLKQGHGYFSDVIALDRSQARKLVEALQRALDNE